MPSLEMISARLSPAQLPGGEVEALYVHIPFCFHKCHYCDFYSITRQSAQRMERFVDLMLQELDLWLETPDLKLKPRTVFFGGGTPSLLPMEQMQRLLAGLHHRIDFSACNEWTVEVNPATADADYLKMLRAAGVSRISMGAQSFDRQELKVLERHHDPDDIPRSLDMARNAAFDRINLDLIFAIPGQTLDQWMTSLETAIALKTDHLSCYGLTYEPNTPMAVKKRLGQIDSVESEIEVQMLRATRSRLQEIGTPPYEISNYARPGQACRHNLMYWNGGNYIGLGPSAASHVRGWRWRNRPHLGEWESAIEKKDLPAIELETLSPLHRAGELAMLQLRLATGINLPEFHKQTEFDANEIFADILKRFASTGLLEITESSVRLSDTGIAVADSIASEFLSATL